MVTPPITVPLENISTGDYTRVSGRKTASLGALIKAGFPVPEGFAVTSTAWERCVESSEFWEKVKELLPKIESLDEDSLSKSASEISDLINAVQINEPIEQDIRQAYSNLGEGNPYVEVIVRTDPVFHQNEPPPPSGLYECRPGIQGYDALFDGIRKIWSEAFNPKALRYLARVGALHRPPRMAVIVQRMVPADVSGTLYTSDPATGNPDVLVLEATGGVTDNSPGKRPQPEIFHVARADWQLEERRLTGPRPSGLTEELACALAKFGGRVEEQMGAPQAVNWCAVGGNFHIVGAKPMTETREHDAGRKWSRLDWAAEFMTDEPMTPCTKSIMMPLVEKAAHSAMKNAGIRIADDMKLFTDLYGRLHVNSAELTDHLAQLMNIYPEIAPETTLKDDVLAPAKPKGTIGNLMTIFRAGKAARKINKRLEKTLPALLQRKKRLERTDLRGKSDAALYLLTEEVIEDVIEPLITARTELRLCLILLHSTLRNLLESKIPDRAAEIHAALPPSPLGKALTRDTWKLGRLAESIGRIPEKMEELTGWQEIQLFALRVEGGELFNRRLVEFLNKYGYLSSGILECARGGWKEQSQEPAAMIVMMAKNGEITDPTTRMNTASARAAENYRETTKSTGFFASKGLKHCLEKARASESSTQKLDKSIAEAALTLRKMLLETGRRFRARNEIASDSDVFFLRLEEIKKLLSLEVLSTAPEELVNRRREEFNNLRQVDINENQRLREPETTRPAEITLHGIGVCSGEYTGSARVIRKPEDIRNLGQGQVAVLPGMNSAMYPLAGVAGAMVSETGSFVSGIGLISRAFGLPCVACVQGACNCIRTGDIITVNGGAGVVSVTPSAKVEEEISQL